MPDDLDLEHVPPAVPLWEVRTELPPGWKALAEDRRREASRDA